MTVTVKNIVVRVAASLILFACNLAFAALPEGLMIAGYDGNGWYPYISQPGSNSWMKLADIRDPSNLTRQAGTDRLLIKGNDGKLYQYQLDTKELKHLESFDNTNNTQLRADAGGFVMVQLIEGKSRDTRIISVDSENKTQPRAGSRGDKKRPHAAHSH